MIRPSHHRAGSAQQVWIVFGGAAHLGWQRWLRPGFRHCFAALHDDEGWLVVDPLSRCLVVARIDVPAGFDLPAFYRRAGLTPLGPFPAGEAGPTRLPALLPMHCVGICRALLGVQAPFALTPASLHAVLSLSSSDRKKSLTSRVVRRYTTLINGRVAPEAKPAPLTRALAFFSSMTRRSKALMASLFKAPKPVRIDPPAPPPVPAVPSAVQASTQASTETQARVRRGIQGTIATSERGVLAPAPALFARKSLLGE